MKTLVTGATGFIGSELVRQLVARGEDVAIFRRSSSTLDLLGQVADRVEHRLGDVTDPESIHEAMRGIQRVYHTAAFVGFGRQREYVRLFEINVGGTAHVVNAALRAGVERVVHTSSIAAFGRPENTEAVIDEDTVWQPSPLNTAYARSKREAELEVYRSIAEGLDAVIVNPALVFGPGRSVENTMQIPVQIKAGKLPAIPSGGTCVVDVGDVAAGMRLAMEHGETGQRYFLGGENLSWQTIIYTLADALEVPPPRHILPPWLAMVVATLSEGLAFFTRSRPIITRETARLSSRTYRYSNRKAVNALGASFRPFERTAERIAASLQADD